MSKKLDRYKQERDKAAAQVKRFKDKEKILDHKSKQLTRKERTHRLCNRGGALESFLKEPLILTDDDVYEFLRFLFSLPETQRKEAELTCKRLKIIENGGVPDEAE